MVPANFQAANMNVTYPVNAAVSGAGSTGLSAATPGEGLTNVTVHTDPNGNFGSVSISLPNVAGTIVTSDVNLSIATPVQLAALSSMLKQVFGPFIDDATALALNQSAGAQALNWSAFGLWSYSYENDPHGNGAGRSHAFAFGNLTPASSVPATGSATYNGTTMGMGGGPGDNSLNAVQGNAKIVANFAGQSVTTSLTNLTTQNIYTNVAGSLPDLTGTSTISGNAYSGPIAGTGLSGSIKGNFYGPAAQETAGVWQASGGGSTWLGSYGAK
jgi:hypothetical protein